MSEELSQEFADNVVRNAVDLWIRPEINRRKEAGVLPENFSAYAIQVIFDDDLEGVQVRFNEEVDAVLEVELTRELRPGDDVTIEDIGSVRRVQLTDRDANAGHFTIVRHKGGWCIAFDFNRNVARSQQYLEVAREFFESSESALNRGHLRAFVENLHSVAELIAKGLLIMHDSSLLKSKKHTHVSTKYNLWGHMGNVPADHTQLLNALQSFRNNARYLGGNFSLAQGEAQSMLSTADEMIKDLDGRIERSKRARASVSES